MSTRKPVIVITGASKGLGLAVTTLLLSKFNSRVVALSRSSTPELLNLASDDLLILPCDVANEVALTDALVRAEQVFHHIDGLVLNAGILDPMGKIGDPPPVSEWKTHFDVNFFSLVTALKASLPALRKSDLGGRVVFVSSGSAVKSTSGWGPYSASKAALNSLCRTLAEEEPSIVSVALRPGMVDTNMQSILRGNEGNLIAAADQQKFVDAYNEGRLVKPETAGHVIAALIIHAHKELSGQFVSWDSEQCKPFRDA